MCLCDSSDNVTQTTNEITVFLPLLSSPIRRYVALSVIVSASMYTMLLFILRPLSIHEQGSFLEEKEKCLPY